MPSLKSFGKPTPMFYLCVPLLMFPNPLPCMNANGCEFFSSLSHHPVAKMTNTKNGRPKMHAKLLCQMNRRLTKLKGCAKHVEPWHGKHMRYDGMSGGVVNQDGKLQWYLRMLSVSKPKKEEKFVMSKALATQKLMIVYVRCMMFNDVLNLLLLCISDHNQDKEHIDTTYGMDGHLV